MRLPSRSLPAGLDLSNRLKVPAAWRPRIGKRALAAAALGIGAAAVAVAALSGGDGGEAAAQDTGVPTTPLERRDLVARESVDGTLGFAGEAEVINRMAGTITWLPAEGDLIGRGRRLYEVDGEPVLLLYGDVPAYRDLASGIADGPDVAELESNLEALGFDPGTVDQEFTSTTASAVSDWQDSLGLEQTGTVELGRVVFMAGERRVTSLDVSLGSDASSAGSAGDGATASTADGTGTIFASYVSDPADPAQAGDEPGDDDGKGKKPAKGGKGPQKQPAKQDPSATPGAQAPAAESPEPEGESDDPAAGEGTTNPSTPVMTTSSERRIVTVQLDPSDASLAERGQSARVSLPDGEEVKGRIATVGTVAQSEEGAEGESTETTIEVTISLPEGGKVTGLDQAPVTVELSDEVRRDVFAVPVEALLGTAGDEYAIVVNDATGRHQVPVTPGLFADGYVEVEGESLQEGAEVEVPGE